MPNKLNARQRAEQDMLIGLSSNGIAAIAIIRNLFRALQAKGVFSEIEVLAIFDSAAELARGKGDPESERFAEAVRTTIRQCQDSVLKIPAPSKRH